ncbi:MAG TPA: hypothetical protein VFW25_07080 [Silvibacterium sp.]|nr:hypothetical protein [Silvibacterium sp.]
MLSEKDVLNVVEKRLPKVIDARTHGIIDYCHATFFFGMALLCRRKNRRAATAALVTGAFVLVESLLTDYPLGAEQVISFSTHGRMDAGFAASSLAVPRIFGFEHTGAAKVFKVNAFVESAVVGLTDFSSDHAREKRLAA